MTIDTSVLESVVEAPTFTESPDLFEIEIESPDGDLVLIIEDPTVDFVIEPPKSSDAVIVPVEGPQGPPGISGTDSFYYRHNQTLPSAGWTIVHNLGKKPSIAVIVGGETIGVAVQHLDLNTAYVPFAVPVSGEAVCS